ncbi:unnamed protein product [Brassicogethes aeneus]|uniref:Uncharacterized protein n=1 Tax=Brassicogethes aeneus TaxID=1431903 RepID=A0A9P0BJ34_BRAAE|nr:unnamed protein product [Brassicogethes aeneus]
MEAAIYLLWKFTTPKPICGPCCQAACPSIVKLQSNSKRHFSSRYANCGDENSSAEGCYGSAEASCSSSPPGQHRHVGENIYEAICRQSDEDEEGDEEEDPPTPTNQATNRGDQENIYETIEDLRQRQQASFFYFVEQQLQNAAEPLYDNEQPSCSSTYGMIGNAYGRIDVIGHGIGRIERHLSSSCGSINSNHYAALDTVYGSCSGAAGGANLNQRTMPLPVPPPLDRTGRISKVSVQWLLANKWLPLWIANTDQGGRDYRIIDFLLAQGLEQDEDEDDDEDGAAVAAAKDSETQHKN